jgi:hypothetical protein
MLAQREVKLNKDTNLLKLIAITTMLRDHLGARVFPGVIELRIIGRLAFPIFAYCIAVGCVYTRNIGKYALRIIIMAVLVQPLYALAMRDNKTIDYLLSNIKYGYVLFTYFYFEASNVNIFFSLTMGILMIWSLKEKNIIAAATVALSVFLIGARLDYGWEGIVMMLLFYLFIEVPIAAVVSVGLLMIKMGAPIFFTHWTFQFYNIQLYALAALPLICLRMNSGIKVPKYIFYAFYPAHMLLIYLILTYNLFGLTH